jgi:hypothetical protein
MITLPTDPETKRTLITAGAAGSLLAVSAVAARYFKDNRLLHLGVLASGPTAALAFIHSPIPTEDPTKGPLKDFRSVGELREHFPLNRLTRQFQEHGGELQVLNWNSGESVTLPERGNIYPVCEQGRNRSQLTCSLLKRTFGDRVQPPHGAMGGCDPFMHYTEERRDPLHWTRPARGEFPDPGSYGFSSLDEEGERDPVGRIPRIGEEHLISTRRLDPALFTQVEYKVEFRIEEGMSARGEMRTWMDENYFKPIIEEGGTIIAFNKSAHVMLLRLVEVAERENLQLNKVTLIATEADDPVVASDQANAIRWFTSRLGTAFIPQGIGE